MFPERLPQDALSDAERRLFDALHDQFSDDWAVFWGVRFLFRNFPLRRITTEIYEFATATLGIVRAMGAEEAGFIREHFWHEDRYWGVHLMVLTRENWNRCRERFVDVIEVQERFGDMTVRKRPAAWQVEQEGAGRRANGTGDLQEVSDERVET